MLATLDLLEAKKRETFAILREGEQDHLSPEARGVRLEEQMKTLYQWTIQQSKSELSVREVFDLWDKMYGTKWSWCVTSSSIMSARSPEGCLIQPRSMVCWICG